MASSSDSPTECHPRRPNLACTPMLLALVVLVANDWWLKAQYPGWITGKLSDVAGLLALGGFLIWLLPRFRQQALIVAALAFTFWKSSLATPLIEAWNLISIVDIARAPDPTDLLTLPALWLGAAAVARSRPEPEVLRSVAVAVVALFAFTATSVVHEIPLAEHGTSHVIIFDETIDELQERLLHCQIFLTAGSDDTRYSLRVPLRADNGSLLTLVSTEVILTERSGYKALHLERIWIGRQPFPSDDELVRRCIHEIDRCIREQPRDDADSHSWPPRPTEAQAVCYTRSPETGLNEPISRRVSVWFVPE